MAAVIEGKPKLAVTAAEAHLDEYPRDALVLSMLLGAFGLYAFSGRPDHDAAKLAVCERLASHYGEDWWFLSYLGWSHTEAGNLGTGRALSERAMALRSENANAAHGLSHAMFEQGDMDAGRKFLSQWLPAHDRKSFLHGHLWWHMALTALDDGDLDGALAIYEQQIKPADRPYPPLNIFTDGASLLWRLWLAGKDGLEPHWRDVAAYGDNISRRPARISPTSITRWPRRQSAAMRWMRDWRNWKPAPPTANWRRAARRSTSAAASRHSPTGDNDGAIRLLEPVDGRSGADRRQPRPARIVGGHADRGVSARRTRRQGRQTDFRPARPPAFGTRRGLGATSGAWMATLW